MRQISILVVVAGLCAGTLGVAFAQILFSPTRDPIAGARLFATKGCEGCHVMNGVGGKNGPDLGRVARPRSFYDLAAAMWNHLPHMSGRIWASGADRPYLTPNEMSDLIAFLYTPDAFGRPGAVEGGERFFAESGDPQRGGQLVTSKGCLACHALPGEEASGKIGRGFDRLQGSESPWIVLAAMWNHSFLMALKTESQSRAWPQLTPEETADLLAFLARK